MDEESLVKTVELLKSSGLAETTAFTLASVFREIARINGDQNAYDMSENVSKHGELPAIRSMLDIKPPRCEFGVVAPLSDDPISSMLENIGLVDWCIKTMGLLESNRPVVNNATAVLMAMTVRNSTNQIKACTEESLGHICKIIKSSEFSETAKFWACGLLRNVARRDENMEKIKASGVVAPLFQLIQSQNMVLREAAAGAIWNSAWGGTINVLELDGIEHVVKLLYSDNENIINCGSSILMNVTMTFNPAVTEKIANAGAIPPLVKLLRHSNEKIQYSAGGALSNLATSPENQAIIGELGAIDALVDMLASTNESIQESAAGALWNLGHLEENRDRIGERGVIALLRTLKGSATDIVMENACGALAQLTLNHNLRQVLMENNGLELLIKIFLSTTNERIELTISQILYDLTWMPSWHTDIELRNKILAKISAMLHSTKLELRLVAAAVLYAPSYEPELLADVVPHLIQVLKEENDHRMLVNLLECLCNIQHGTTDYQEQLLTPDIQDRYVELLNINEEEVLQLLLSILNKLVEGGKLLKVTEKYIPALAKIAQQYDQDEIGSSAWSLISHINRNYYYELERSGYLLRLLEYKKTLGAEIYTKILEDLKAAIEENPITVTIEPTSPQVDMGFLVNNKLYSDIVLVIDGEKLYAHRAILHGRSAYFRAMFESGMIEAQKEEVPLLTEWPASIWLEVLRFIYTDNCNINEDNIMPLLELADKYNFTKLTSLCESYLASILSEDNAWNLLRLAIERNATQLRTMAIRYITLHFNLDTDVDEETLKLLSY